MISKKKLHFLQLTFVFTAITIGTVLLNWSSNTNIKNSMSMMGQSMGNMMSSMHLKNAKLSDLVTSKEQTNTSKSKNMSNETKEGYLKEIHYITTTIIVVLLPFIIGGTVFLAIVWFK